MSLDVIEVTQYHGEVLERATIRWANEIPRTATILVHYSLKTPGAGQPNNVIAVTIFITQKVV
jgi:hypothetical protein